VSVVLEKNAFKEMREMKNVDQVRPGVPFEFFKRLVNRVMRIFTGPQTVFNERTLDALNIIAYNLEKLREHVIRLEEKDNRNFGQTGDQASDFKRLSLLVSDHLSHIYANADTIHRDIGEVTSSLGHMLDHLKGVAETMGEIRTQQADSNGEVASARHEMTSLWTELDLLYTSLDQRSDDIWKGLEERDKTLGKHGESLERVNILSREIKARLLVISEQMNLHQEMLETLQTRVGTPVSARREASAAAALEGAPAPTAQESDPRSPSARWADASTRNMLPHLMGLAYMRFQRQYRGDDDELAQRQLPYVELLRRWHEVPALMGEKPRILDVACGDGIFLQQVMHLGWDCQGVDMNKSMVNIGASHGVPIMLGDALEFLQTAEEKSFSAVTAFQFVEHLEAEKLMLFLKGAHRVLRPGGFVLVETINPNTLMSLRWFHMDLTHQRLVYPEVLQLVAETIGYQDVEWKGVNPVDSRIQLAVEGSGVEARNAKRLNELLFGYQDYYLIARKSSAVSP